MLWRGRGATPAPMNEPLLHQAQTLGAVHPQCEPISPGTEYIRCSCQLLSQIMPPLQVFVTVRTNESSNTAYRTGGISAIITCGGSADLPFMQKTHVNTGGHKYTRSFTFLEGEHQKVWHATRDYQPTCSTTKTSNHVALNNSGIAQTLIQRDKGSLSVKGRISNQIFRECRWHSL